MSNPAAQCPKCGRFAPATYAAGYDGTWNQEWITTYCAEHGKLTRTVV